MASISELIIHLLNNNKLALNKKLKLKTFAIK